MRAQLLLVHLLILFTLGVNIGHFTARLTSYGLQLFFYFDLRLCIASFHIGDSHPRRNGYWCVFHIRMLKISQPMGISALPLACDCRGNWNVWSAPACTRIRTHFGPYLELSLCISRCVCSGV